MLYSRVAKLTFFLFAVFSGALIFAQDGSVPAAILRPDRAEAPRYPQDLVIGELGQGKAPEGAYRFAFDLVSNLAAGTTTEAAALTKDLLEEIASLEVRSYRIGGGRTEPDGNVSFLLRFLGQLESITGELFVRLEEDKWVLDDLVLEERRILTEIRDSYRYDFSPYERFF